MSTKTKNYQFVKPEENEFYDINIPNKNRDMADAELKKEYWRMAISRVRGYQQ